MSSYKKYVEKTELAHQDEIFKKKGREPTNYGADTNINSPGEQSSHFGSKTSDNGYLHTSHDHVTGKITHKWSYPKNKNFRSESEELDEAKAKPEPVKKDSEMSAEEREKLRKRRMAFVNNEGEEIDEASVSKATLEKYRAKAKTKFREKGGITAALAKQDKEKKVEVRKEDIDEGDGPHSVEFYDARERKAKAKWHYDRTGKQKGASLSKGIKHDYEAELLRRGVKDSNGNQKPLRKEDVEQLDELSPKTLKSYVKKATKKADRAWDKGDKEEDKAMSTDGYKYPEKQARHNAAAQVQHKIWNKRTQGVGLAKTKLAADADINLAKRGGSGPSFKAIRKESIVDLLMVNDDIEAMPYISEIEARCDAIVAEIKNELAVSLFDFTTEGHTINQLKQAGDAHKYHRDAYLKQSEFNLTGKKKHGADPSKAVASDKMALKHNRAVNAADSVRYKMSLAGASHSSQLKKKTLGTVSGTTKKGNPQ